VRTSPPVSPFTEMTAYGKAPGMHNTCDLRLRSRDASERQPDFGAQLNTDVVTPRGSTLCNNHREYGEAGYMAPRDAGIGHYPIQESERLLGLDGS
jgi:nuclear transport factor 2 (NTF2) superfamily protein